jgi:hypothetical protein
LLPLPPYSPELNPQENIWQYLRQNYLANRVFETYEAIVDACCDAWNKLQRSPAALSPWLLGNGLYRSRFNAVGIRNQTRAAKLRPFEITPH